MDSLTSIVDYIIKLLNGDESILDIFSNLVWGIIYIIVEGVFTIIETMISGINLGNVATSIASNWMGLPDALVYLINAAGVPQMLTVIGWAYGIRFLLNLIPATFTRI